MKILQMLILALFSAVVLAYPVDQEGNLLIPEPLKEVCTAKGDVTLFVYQHRDKITQQDALTVFERDWNEVWSENPNITRATYVDMQRIIRDAYRTDGKGEYIRDCCTKDIAREHTVKELRTCLYELEY